MFDNWQYKNEKWTRLPEWCNTFGAIGKAIATYHNENRLIAAFSLPTRAYAAVFMSLGIVLDRAKIPVEDIDNADHFLRLCNLPKGTSLYYRQGNKNLKATLDGYENNERGSYIFIKLNSGSQRQGLPSNMVHNIQLADQEFDHLPKSPKGSTIAENKEFIAANLIDCDVDKFCQCSRLEATILTNEKEFSSEINIPIKTSSESSGFCYGRPKDILRIKKYFQGGQGYRADLQSDRNEPINDEIPHVVIFDGARSYVNWRDSWRKSNWIVLLDKTETKYEEAVDALNKEYTYNHIDDISPQLPTLPMTVESLVYEELR